MEKVIPHKQQKKKKKEEKKESWNAILLLDKTDFKTKIVIRLKEGYFIMLKGQIHEEDITIIKIYTTNK